MTELTIGVRADPSGTVLTLTGEVDFTNSARLRRAIRQALAATPHTLTVDLAGLGFCDSAGISALIAGRQEADVRRVGYQVTNPGGAVALTLDVSGVLGYLSAAAKPDPGAASHGNASRRGG